MCIILYHIILYYIILYYIILCVLCGEARAVSDGVKIHGTGGSSQPSGPRRKGNLICVYMIYIYIYTYIHYIYIYIYIGIYVYAYMYVCLGPVTSSGLVDHRGKHGSLNHRGNQGWGVIIEEDCQATFHWHHQATHRGSPSLQRSVKVIAPQAWASLRDPGRRIMLEGHVAIMSSACRLPIFGRVPMSDRLTCVGCPPSNRHAIRLLRWGAALKALLRAPHESALVSNG